MKSHDSKFNATNKDNFKIRKGPTSFMYLHDHSHTPVTDKAYLAGKRTGNENQPNDAAINDSMGIQDPFGAMSYFNKI